METLNIQARKDGDILNPDTSSKEPYKGPVVRGDEAVENKEEEKLFDPGKDKKQTDLDEENQNDTGFGDDEDSHLKE